MVLFDLTELDWLTLIKVCYLFKFQCLCRFFRKLCLFIEV